MSNSHYYVATDDPMNPMNDIISDNCQVPGAEDPLPDFPYNDDADDRKAKHPKCDDQFKGPKGYCRGVQKCQLAQNVYTSVYHGLVLDDPAKDSQSATGIPSQLRVTSDAFFQSHTESQDYHYAPKYYCVDNVGDPAPWILTDTTHHGVWPFDWDIYTYTCGGNAPPRPACGGIPTLFQISQGTDPVTCKVMKGSCLDSTVAQLMGGPNGSAAIANAVKTLPDGSYILASSDRSKPETMVAHVFDAWTDDLAENQQALCYYEDWKRVPQ